MDDCNRFAELKKLQEELCSDSSMDDCNKTGNFNPGNLETGSDSSMDDCNLSRPCRG